MWGAQGEGAGCVDADDAGESWLCQCIGSNAQSYGAQSGFPGESALVSTRIGAQSEGAGGADADDAGQHGQGGIGEEGAGGPAAGAGAAAAGAGRPQRAAAAGPADRGHAAAALPGAGGA